MLFQWIDHPRLTRIDQLLSVIYDLGMASKEQIAQITGWNRNNLNDIIYRARKLNPGFLNVNHTPVIKGSTVGVYTLGRAGIVHVHELRELPTDRVREAPAGQIMHYIGINDILCRALEEANRDDVQWYSAYEVGDLFTMMYSDLKIDFDGRRMIRPDGRLRMNDTDLLIEFDNDTEGPKALESKYHRYVDLYNKLKLRYPIIWVTINERRRSYLERNWEALKKVTYNDFPELPNMYFFLEGQETEYIKRLLRQGA